MSRAPPTTPAVKFPESSAISESPKNSLLTTEGNTKTLYPQLFNVSTSLCFENLPVKNEKYSEHETLHTIPQKLVISSSSCSSNTKVSEIDHLSDLKKNAHSGDSSAQNQLGQYYLSGNNVEINQSKAVSWFRKAALKNNKEAQLNLAVAYKEGRGIKKDLTLATYWLLKSCSSDEGRNVTISYHRDLIKFIAPVLAEFPDFRALKKIEFHRLGLSGEGMTAIAQLIQFNPLIDTLDLSGNDIDDAEALLLMSAIQDNTNLKKLIFNTSRVDPTILSRINTLLSQNCANS